MITDEQRQNWSFTKGMLDCPPLSLQLAKFAPGFPDGIWNLAGAHTGSWCIYKMPNIKQLSQKCTCCYHFIWYYSSQQMVHSLICYGGLFKGFPWILFPPAFTFDNHVDWFQVPPPVKHSVRLVSFMTEKRYAENSPFLPECFTFNSFAPRPETKCSSCFLKLKKIK